MSTTNETLLEEEIKPEGTPEGTTEPTPTAPNYDINYDDERFAQVNSEKTSALDAVEKTYQDMIDQSDSHYQGLIDASKEWADKQSQLTQEKTDFAIDQIEQQKQQSQKDYTKEQSGAYVDWQKQSNQYGANAEKMAAAGLKNTGYSESSQVAMYNTYQNRVATARESFQKAILNYNNSITEARLQNNSMLAEIAYNALQQQLELSLQGFQYKNQLILEKTAKRLEVENMYYNRYQDVLAQINREIALAEQVRQYNETLAEEQRQFDRLYPEEEKSSGGGYGGGYYSGYSSYSNRDSYDDSDSYAPSVKVADDPEPTPDVEPDIKSIKNLNLGIEAGQETSDATAHLLAQMYEAGDVDYYTNNNGVRFYTSTKTSAYDAKKNAGKVTAQKR